MATFLLPISLLIKSYIHILGSSIYFLTEIPLYVYSLMIIAFLINDRHKMGKIDIRKKNLFEKKAFFLILFTLVLQYVAMYFSYHYVGSKGINFEPNKEFLKLNIFIACIFIHYYVVYFAMNTNKSIDKFMIGNAIALIILLIVTYIQFLFLFFPQIFAGSAAFIGKYFESRYDRDWYGAGSYVQTLWRINGFNPESDYLAIQLFVVFVPFVLASIKNKINLFLTKFNYNPLFFYGLLLVIVNLLFFAQTTTGFVDIAIIGLICIIFWISDWLRFTVKKKLIIASVAIVAISILLNIALKNEIIMHTINQNLFVKLGGGSFINRAGGTISLLGTWITHPIAGVGWNYHNYYLFQYLPDWAKHNDEYLTIFLPQQFYPILSVLSGWLAEFGTIVVLFVFIYVYRLLKDLRIIANNTKGTELYVRKVKALSDSAHFFIFFYFISSLLSFPWWESIYLITFFFFVAIRRRLKSNKTLVYNEFCNS